MRVSILLLVLGVAWSASAAVTPGPDAVNAVLGDVSWVARHGAPPGPDAPEAQRIRTHLEYAADRLAARPVDHLDAARRARRAQALVDLRAYAADEVFPRRSMDDGYGPRRPRFIDDRGVHCAVGELMRRSGHGALARAIDRHAEYAFVPQITDPALDRWAGDHGFTRHELAMIQPSYHSETPDPTGPVGLWVDFGAEAVASCAAQHRPQWRIELEIESWKVRIPGRRPNPFEACVVKRLQALTWRTKKSNDMVTYGDGAFHYRYAIRVLHPETCFAEAALNFDMAWAPHCFGEWQSRPEIEWVRLEVDGSKVDLRLRITPRDVEQEACVARALWEVMGPIGPDTPYTLVAPPLPPTSVVDRLADAGIGPPTTPDCREIRAADPPYMYIVIEGMRPRLQADLPRRARPASAAAEGP